MPLFPQLDENAIFFSQTDPDADFSAFAALSFYLDGRQWPTVIHYYQAQKFEDKALQEKIANADTPKRAQKLGSTRFKKRRSDWKQVKVTMMTRAVYTQMRTHQQLTDKLLETGDKQLVANSNYDYFWGCGRDRRGDNHYGRVLMAVRNKLKEEQHA